MIMFLCLIDWFIIRQLNLSRIYQIVMLKYLVEVCDVMILIVEGFCYSDENNNFEVIILRCLVMLFIIMIYFLYKRNKKVLGLQVGSNVYCFMIEDNIYICCKMF